MIQYFVKIPIFKRLIPSLGIRILRFLKKNRGFFKIGEINFYLDFLDPIDRQIILNKNYEKDQVSFFRKKMEKTEFEYFLDIGSNSGYYSFYFGHLYKKLKIKAFEPNLEPYNKFLKTLNKNSFKNIEVFNFGLSNQEKKVYMSSMISHKYTHSNSTIIENFKKKVEKNIQISEAYLKVGDQLFNFSNKKICIKIDVEGHEIFTLKGLINNLLKNRCLMMIEISDNKFDEVNKFLTDNKFMKIFKSKYRSDYIYTNFLV
tara:strand:+ start:112 stop:888 length:777 start_codon:yes stop_codon:yes gene_type:complete